MNHDTVKFLVVDDIDENIVALSALLRREGLEILVAHSGAEALELLLVHDVALALLDVQMPEMDGFELAELMRGAERTKHVPIIFVTAGARDPLRVFKGYDTGAVDFLFKPIDPHVLKSKADTFFELYRQRQALANALRLNEMFVGVVGHDLRNPLSAIVTGARLLEHQIQDPGQLRTISRMVSASQRMTNMIEQLLDLTRVRAGGGVGFVRASEPVAVDALVQRAVDELASTHPERQILVDATSDAMAVGDAERLLQLFSNLVANAIHHGAPDQPISISVRVAPRNVVVSVHNGGAIPDAIRAKIFDPFRERDLTRQRSRGLGLGLFIAQQITLGHGGQIELSSSAAGGTRFTVHLPRAT
jgi:two-component system, sensor histidine kinase and response regulator